MQYVQREYPLTEEEQAALAIERQQHEKELRLRNNRLGISVFQISWTMAFIVLIVSYWQLGFDPQWRPSPEQAPNPILPTIATLALLVSAWLTHRALKIAKNTQIGEAPRFRATWLSALGLGVLFWGIMFQQYFVISALSFGMIYRLMIGFHALHALVIGFMLFQVWRLGKDGRYTLENHWALEGTMRLWDFVLAMWLLFYVILYLPFLMQ
jgi:heme/copper-type cytochrome/quinol oxidase subunit 3